MEIFAVCWDTMTLFILHQKNKKAQQQADNLEEIVSTRAQPHDVFEPLPNHSNVNTRPAELPHRRVTFFLDNKDKHEEPIKFPDVPVRQTQYSVLKEELEKIPKVRFSLFNRNEATKN